MRKNYGIYFFAGGLLFLVLQLVILIFGYINYDTTYGTDQIFYLATDLSIGDFLSHYWSGVVGTILLIVLFVRRLTRGPEAMMVLVGVLLWVIQLLSLHNPDQPLIDFIGHYLVGFIGIAGSAVAGFYDAYLIKSEAPKDPDDDRNIES